MTGGAAIPCARVLSRLLARLTSACCGSAHTPARVRPLCGGTSVEASYRAKFGLPEQTVVQELARLKTYGGLVLSVSEVLHSLELLEVIWTVPAEQEDPSNPQAVESLRPGSTAA